MVDYRSLEQKYGLPENYLVPTRRVESAGGRNTFNPLSRAAGDFQFIPRTARAYGLTNPYDPAASADAAARLARDNMAALRRAGIEITPENLYLAHQQGAAGAVRLLSGGNVPAQQIVGQRAVNWNSGNAQMTGPQFADTVRGKFLSAAGVPQAVAPPVQSQAQVMPAAQAAPQQPAAPVYANDFTTMARRAGNYLAPSIVDAPAALTPEQIAAQQAATTANAETSRQYNTAAAGLLNLARISAQPGQAPMMPMLQNEPVRGQYRPIPRMRGLL